MPSRIDLSTKLAEAHSYEHLRQLAELALHAMSLHLLVQSERMVLDEKSTQGEKVEVLSTSARVNQCVHAVSKLGRESDLESSAQELGSIRTMLESAVDPQIAALNRVLYTQ